MACESGALLMLCESNLFYMPKACPYGGDIDNFTYYVFPNYIEVKTIQS